VPRDRAVALRLDRVADGRREELAGLPGGRRAPSSYLRWSRHRPLHALDQVVRQRLLVAGVIELRGEAGSMPDRRCRQRAGGELVAPGADMRGVFSLTPYVQSIASQTLDVRSAPAESTSTTV
jgi:hypothetical protein